MAKTMCIQNFSSGDGVAYEAGVEYDVPEIGRAHV